MSMIDPANGPLPIDASDWATEWQGEAAPAPKPRARARSTAATPLGLHMLTDVARARLSALVEDARDSLVAQVRGLNGFADQLTRNLGTTLGDNAEPVTRMIGTATGTIDQIADALAEKSVDELVEDGRELVRAQPVVAVGLAIAVGFLIGRIAKVAQD